MASTMEDLLIRSLRGGMNNSDPAIALDNDQSVLAQNVEFIDSMLGERRRGSDAIDLTSSNVGSRDQITFLYRHLPTADETAAELWAVGLTGTATLSVSRKTTAWTNPTVSDTPLLTGFAPFQWAAQSLHGKLFFAYDSNVDRLHVWDGTSMRRVGLTEPAAPTGANDGGVGTFAGTRYYRVRYTVQASSVTILRSEPSDVLTFSPNGNDTGVVVTKPTTISEGETHWELEASTDNVNFFRIATTAVGTGTSTDTTDFNTGYAAAGTLSEDVGDYALIPSGRYLVADEDRLIIAGSWEDTAQGSRVRWTPVFGASGVGNDERLETDTDPFIDLDGFDGGAITGMSTPMMGSIFVFKQNHIYKLVRSGRRRQAYDAILYTDKRGAVHGSVTEGLDNAGRPCIYFLDPGVGPCRLGVGGIRSCGADIRATFETVNLDATKVVSASVYYPRKRQVHWWIATASSNVPDTHMVLQTNETRDVEDGETRRGWALWTGPSAGALTACLFADNIDAGIARSRDLAPFIGIVGAGLIHRCDTGDDDNGTEYVSKITTKPYTVRGILHKFGVMSAMLLAKAVTGASLDLVLTRDFGLETKTLSGIAFTATVSETQVMKLIDDIGFSELQTLQFTFQDVSTPGTRWELNAMQVSGSQQQHN